MLASNRGIRTRRVDDRPVVWISVRIDVSNIPYLNIVVGRRICEDLAASENRIVPLDARGRLGGQRCIEGFTFGAVCPNHKTSGSCCQVERCVGLELTVIRIERDSSEQPLEG